jgi:prevent-host-death family protein
MVTMVMKKAISKSKFKAMALEYFREVGRTGVELVITDRGRPVLKLVPYREEVDSPASSLRETVVRYDDPTEPVGVEDWELLE